MGDGEAKTWCSRFNTIGAMYLTLTVGLTGPLKYDRTAAAFLVLSQAGRLSRWNRGPSKKGTGFVQPQASHEHWHLDIACLNLGGILLLSV